MLRRLLVLVVAAVLLLPQSAQAVLPIEDFAHYVPQTNCNPTPKPGTLKLAAWLQRKYPGTGSLGISRSCKGGGVSEHKEGRAFDWAVSVHSARDRAYVRDFFDRLFATDAAGNPDALARRMGVMYILWNDHIWAAYDHFERRDYLAAGCKKASACNDTVQHRNHVHISLTRRAARGLTSWYDPAPATPTQPAPAPAPAPRPAPGPPTPQAAPSTAAAAHRVTVPTDGTVRTTRFRIRAGRRYQVVAAGLYQYGTPRQVADAACVWSADGWRPTPTSRVLRRHGSLDLRVDGVKLFGSTCRRSHVYRAVFLAKHDRTVRLRVGNRGTSVGRLVVTVSRPGTDVHALLPTYPSLTPPPVHPTALAGGHGLLAETVAVPGTHAVSTGQQVRAGVSYRITVSGTVGLHGARTDGVCLYRGGSWYRQASLDRRRPDADHGQLYVDGAPFAAGGGCGTRAHSATWTATRTGRLPLAVWDPLDRTDDTGALRVRVQRLTAIAEPAPGPRAKVRPRAKAWQLRRDWVAVPSSATSGVLSTMRVRKGATVQVVVRGTQRSGATLADAACVRTAAGWVRRDPAVALAQDPLDLWVDGQRVGWRALGRTDGCSQEHAYSARVTATKSGPLRLAVLDLDHSDNQGALSVTLLRG